MRLVLVVLALSACQPDGKDYPRLPGGGGPGGGAGSGSGGDDGGTDATGLVGTVCLLTDLRDLTQCEPTGAGNLTVTLGTRTATTADDGSFTMDPPTGSTLTWRVTGAGMVPTVMGFSAIHRIPVISTTDYQTLIDSNGFLVLQGQGAIVTQVVIDEGDQGQPGGPVPGALVDSNPDGQGLPLYDGSSPLVWDVDATGPFGMSWIFGVPVGVSTVTVVPPGGGSLPLGVTVEDGAITFATFGL